MEKERQLSEKPNGLESLKGFQEDPPEEFESPRGKRSPQELDNTEIRYEFESRLQEDPPEELESLRGKRSPHRLQEDPPEEFESRGKRSSQRLQEDPPEEFESRGKRSPQRLQEDPPEEFESRGKRSPQRLQEDPPEEFESRGKRSPQRLQEDPPLKICNKPLYKICNKLVKFVPQSFQEDPPEELESSRGKRSVQIPAGAGLIRMARRSNGGGRRRNGVGLLDNTGLRSNGLQEDPPEELGSRRGRRSPQGLLDNTELRSNGLQEDPPEELGSRRGRRSPQAPGVAGLTRSQEWFASPLEGVQEVNEISGEIEPAADGVNVVKRESPYIERAAPRYEDESMLEAQGMCVEVEGLEVCLPREKRRKKHRLSGPKMDKNKKRKPEFQEIGEKSSLKMSTSMHFLFMLLIFGFFAMFNTSQVSHKWLKNLKKPRFTNRGVGTRIFWPKRSIDQRDYMTHGHVYKDGLPDRYTTPGSGGWYYFFLNVNKDVQRGKQNLEEYED
ncbi:hypothetical protein RR48_03515 [Papilio machaon]|uniref:Uncharacterized protein n=1 Tax=Papilio machaon TaxID=76193 RepID=A0A0N1PK11_PAPMA|nr:hypothetical protein RR48_03515 [Papilio machaon]